MKDLEKICSQLTASHAYMLTSAAANHHVLQFKLYLHDEEIDEIQLKFTFLPEALRDKPGQVIWLGREYIYNDEENDYRLLLESVSIYTEGGALYYALIGAVDGLKFIKTYPVQKS